MPSAPTYQALYDFEGQLEDAAAAVLATQSIVTVTSRSAVILSTPRVEIQCVLGPPTGHMAVRQGAVEIREEFDSFTFQLRVIVVTNRIKSPSFHRTMRGMVRYLLSTSAEYFDVTNLPYVEIDALTPAGCAPSIISDKEEDITEMAYTGTVSIREDGWPADSGDPITDNFGQQLQDNSGTGITAN